MSDYTPVTDFSAKDSLLTGNPNKLAKGSDIDLETAAIATAIATKYDSADLGVTLQGWDQQLDDIAALTPTDGNFIVGNGTTWVAESGATVRTSLGLGSIATQAASAVAITGGDITGITDLAVADGGTGASTAADARTSLGLVIGTDVQAYSANLAAIAALAVTDSNIIVGNGSTWVAESGATARASLGVSTASTSAEGLSELATSAETYALSSGALVVTPSGLGAVVGAMKVTGVGSATPTIASQGGILSGASVADGDQTGEMVVTTGITMTNADNLIIVLTPDHGADPGADAIKCNLEDVSTTAFQVQMYGAADTAEDGHTVHIMVMRVGA